MPSRILQPELQAGGPEEECPDSLELNVPDSDAGYWRDEALLSALRCRLGCLQDCPARPQPTVASPHWSHLPRLAAGPRPPCSPSPSCSSPCCPQRRRSSPVSASAPRTPGPAPLCRTAARRLTGCLRQRGTAPQARQTESRSGGTNGSGRTPTAGVLSLRLGRVLMDRRGRLSRLHGCQLRGCRPRQHPFRPTAALPEGRARRCSLQRQQGRTRRPCRLGSSC